LVWLRACAGVVPRGSVVPSTNWLQLVSGPAFLSHANSQGVAYPVATLKLSNAGTARVMFRLQDLRWASVNDRGSAAAMPGPVHLSKGATTNLALRMTGSMPSGPTVVCWELDWWEEPTLWRRFRGRLQALVPAVPWALWPEPALLTGKVQPPRIKGDEVVYFRLKYGLALSGGGAGADSNGAANGSQPIRLETNRTSSAAGSRR
jgi:hypothetical protein